MSRSVWAVFLAAIFGLMGTANQGSSPSKVEGRAKSEPQANFVGTVLDRQLEHQFIKYNEVMGQTAALAPAEGVRQLINTTHATANNTVLVKLSDIPVGKVIQVGTIKFVKVGADQYLAINLCPEGSSYQAAYKGCVVKQTNFTYTGGEQTFTAPTNGYYVLEVWGAQGGHADSGYGGYSIGVSQLQMNTKMFVQVGGQGEMGARYRTAGSGGYNGGGNGGLGYSDSYHGGTGGGGATHIATTSGLLSTLSSAINRAKIFLVAGGGGGAQHCVITIGLKAGVGGGASGGTGIYFDKEIIAGATQSTGYAFGQGANGRDSQQAANCDAEGGSGGGGGWYGGLTGNKTGASSDSSGSGGSGYIGSSNLISLTGFTKHMTCYECETSTEAATYTISNSCVSRNPEMDCAKKGNGAARITQLSVYLGI